ncbi:MAG: tRNA (N6-threonylcarbamoyladenosine(37)-N6)-methyltransferase TrmO [Lachnospiraceae bacterium]|nr:tRNA (N6-threonylcarbamoyladenosine(37)-N6)-methyltransferase TrmO [Lachnospiraceae bacterium]
MIKTIAKITTDFDSKFGIPRQPGLIPAARGRIVFEPEFRNPDTVRGLEAFSHLWLIWGFSENVRDDWSATVRPPRLGGNKRLGVFATRSPFRPNPLGLSVVELLSVEPDTPEGPVITVAGVDMLNGTPIYDIKPYVAYTDAVSEAESGFAPEAPARKDVRADAALLGKLPEEKQEALLQVLALDPRPSYHDDPQRVYGFPFAGREVKFRVEGETVVLLEIE